MPFYEFSCPRCKEIVEYLLPIAEYDTPQICPICQTTMKRLISVPCRAIIPETGRDKVLANLNSRDDGVGNKPHIKNALWKGLNQRPEVVGRGF